MFCCLNYINKWVPDCLAGLSLLVNHWSSLNYARQVTLINIVLYAKDKKSKGYDGIDMCLLKKNHSAYPDTIKTYNVTPL